MDKTMIEWTKVTPVLTPDEETERARLQAELDRLDREIKAILQKIADDLNAAIARRLADEVTKR